MNQDPHDIFKADSEDRLIAAAEDQAMRAPIQDQFTSLPISRQRKWQLRRKAINKCTECGAPSDGSNLCLRHMVIARERQRKVRGLKTRYRGAKSYKLEKAR